MGNYERTIEESVGQLAPEAILRETGEPRQLLAETTLEKTENSSTLTRPSPASSSNPDPGCRLGANATERPIVGIRERTERVANCLIL